MSFEILNVNNLEEFSEHLRKNDEFSLDSETTGLLWNTGDRPFLWSISTADRTFLWDVRNSESNYLFYQIMDKQFQREDLTVIFANAKFDLHMFRSDMAFAKILLKCKILDILVLARIMNNQMMRAGLDDVAKLFGYAKDDSVKKYIQKHQLYRKHITLMGNEVKIPEYSKVPNEIMYPYAAKDSRITFDCKAKLMQEILMLDGYNQTLLTPKSLATVIDNEAQLTKTLFNMESEGVLIDESYTRSSFSGERSRFEACAHDFKEITGRELVDSPKAFTEIFRAYPDLYSRIPTTEKGNLSFKDSFLSSIAHPVAESITGYRQSYKKAGTYFGNFLQLKAADGRIRTDFRQSKTRTSRLSASSPNLQNVSGDTDEYEESEKDLSVRRCFVAPEGYLWLSLDYKAQELRMLFDLAGETTIIEKIKAGMDGHEVTAQELGITRKKAKTLNFGLIYGMGTTKLAEALGVSVEEAKEIKYTYFKKIPKVGKLIREVTRKAELGLISNWYGRVYRFEKKFAYKAVNYLIQGGCAEITKIAMNRIGGYLADNNCKTKLVLSIHDELCFYLHKDEMDLIPVLRNIMVEAYEHDTLPMDTSAEIGANWAELEAYA